MEQDPDSKTPGYFGEYVEEEAVDRLVEVHKMGRKVIPELYSEIVTCPATNCHGIVRDSHTNIPRGFYTGFRRDWERDFKKKLPDYSRAY